MGRSMATTNLYPQNQLITVEPQTVSVEFSGSGALKLHLFGEKRDSAHNNLTENDSRTTLGLCIQKPAQPNAYPNAANLRFDQCVNMRLEIKSGDRNGITLPPEASNKVPRVKTASAEKPRKDRRYISDPSSAGFASVV